MLKRGFVISEINSNSENLLVLPGKPYYVAISDKHKNASLIIIATELNFSSAYALGTNLFQCSSFWAFIF